LHREIAARQRGHEHAGVDGEIGHRRRAADDEAAARFAIRVFQVSNSDVGRFVVANDLVGFILASRSS
jgi:hypothetical protein